MAGKILWTPSLEVIKNSNLSQFIQWLNDEKGLIFENYQSLYNWSVSDISIFWESIVQYFEIHIQYNSVLKGQMPKNQWFEGAKLNYVDYIFRQKNIDFPAIIYKTEDQDFQEISWEKLENDVACFQKFLLEKGIKKGDIVAGFLTNCPETLVAFLATVSIGAIWTCVAPDFGHAAILDRFSPLNPKVLIATVSYQYGGKKFDKSSDIAHIQQNITSIEQVVLVNSTQKFGEKCTLWNEIDFNKNQNLISEKLPFDHPIYIVFSSGTTGNPKAIVHRQGGVLLEFLKSHILHGNIKKGERYLWYSTTGWIMWNIAQASLLAGATLVLYNGSPVYPESDYLWKLASDTKLDHFGIGAAYILGSKQAGHFLEKYSQSPQANFDSLKTLGSTGSPLPIEGFEWAYENVKKDMTLMSLSGGTEVSSGFVGGCVHLPVFSGEIQCRMLGCAVEIWNENGDSIFDEMGELMLTKPMPSMPVYFWNDPDFTKYKASYFEEYEGVWRHGDWAKITQNNGVIIYGRSDSTLNKNGIRIGTSEIYRVVEQIEGIADSLILNIEYPDGSSWMPLFVKMNVGYLLNNELIVAIKSVIKTQCSARHIPEEIIEINDIPYTLSNKKVEVPIKKIFLGQNPEKVVNYGALRNPEAVEEYLNIYDLQLNNLRLK